MNRRVLFGVLAVAVLGGGITFFLRPHAAAAHEELKSVSVAPAPLGKSVSPLPAPEPPPVDDIKLSGSTLLGTVQPATQATLSVRAPARLAALLVGRDAFVQRGQLLALLDDKEGQTQIQGAQAGLLSAEAQLGKAHTGRAAQRQKSETDIASARSGLKQAQVKLQQALLAHDAAAAENRAERDTAQAGVRKAQAALDRAQQTRQQLEELAQVGGVSRSDLEGARTQVTIAQADLETARTQVRQLEAGPASQTGTSYRVALAQKDVDAARVGVQQAQEGLHAALAAEGQTLALADQDIRAAQAGLVQAMASVAGARTARQETRLVSPIQGVVSDIAAHVGDTVQPGSPVLSLISLSDLHVDALAPARFLAQLHVGQSATIRVDTLPNRSFAAYLSAISPVAEPNGRSFRVTFRFPHPVSLRPGQSAHISFASH